MWSVSKGSERESLHSKLSDILGVEFENTSENKPEFEITGKKNQQVSEHSVMDLRETLKSYQFCQISLSNMVHCLRSIPPQSWIVGMQKTC